MASELVNLTPAEEGYRKARACYERAMHTGVDVEVARADYMLSLDALAAENRRRESGWRP